MHTVLSLTFKEVERVCEILQIREGADLWRNVTGEGIVCDIKLLYLGELCNGFGEFTRETVEAKIEDSEIGELPNAWIKATSEVVIEQNELIEITTHAPNARRDTTRNSRICKH